MCRASGSGRASKRVGANESIIDDTEEKILTDEIPDAALEIAAGIAGAGTMSLTIAFCSGLDYCQPKLPHVTKAPGRHALVRRTDGMTAGVSRTVATLNHHFLRGAVDE
jgi:hypothetical protein